MFIHMNHNSNSKISSIQWSADKKKDTEIIRTTEGNTDDNITISAKNNHHWHQSLPESVKLFHISIIISSRIGVCVTVVHFSENIIIKCSEMPNIMPDFINEHFICGMHANSQQYFIDTNMEMESHIRST